MIWWTCVNGEERPVAVCLCGLCVISLLRRLDFGPCASVCICTFAAAVLSLMPFLDRNPCKYWLDSAMWSKHTSSTLVDQRLMYRAVKSVCSQYNRNHPRGNRLNVAFNFVSHRVWFPHCAITASEPYCTGTKVISFIFFIILILRVEHEGFFLISSSNAFIFKGALLFPSRKTHSQHVPLVCQDDISLIFHTI